MSQAVDERERRAMTAKIATGTRAIAAGVRDAGVEVVSAYPITPQTEIVEAISEYVESGRLDAGFARVESEHSALAGAGGASQAGTRAFTATASQGLLFMSEMVWWTAGARLPVVMAVANRALGPPWNIWGSHTDALSHRDAGWVQLFAANVQEAYDLTLIAYRIAEDQGVMLPTMVNLDGFTLAETMQPFTPVDPDEAQAYIGDLDVPHRLDMDNPRNYHAMAGGSDFWRFRRDVMDALETVPDVTREAFGEFGDLTGRNYDLVHTYEAEDADVLIVGLGTMAREAEVSADILRDEFDIAAGVVRPMLYTPFPETALREAVDGAEKIVVIDRATSMGRGGITTMDVERSIDQPVASVIAGLGGQSVDYEDIVTIAREAEPGETVWFGGEIQ
ncbi:MAG: transketolase C-terminal domain-containing protein [Halodesulfurarchaeum sp.]